MIKSGLVGDDYEVTPLRSKSRTVNVLRKRVTQNQFDLGKKVEISLRICRKKQRKSLRIAKVRKFG